MLGDCAEGTRSLEARGERTELRDTFDCALIPLSEVMVLLLREVAAGEALLCWRSPLGAALREDMDTVEFPPPEAALAGAEEEEEEEDADADGEIEVEESAALGL